MIKIIKTINTLLIIFILLVLVLLINFNNNKSMKIFNYSIYIVMSNSMEDYFEAGDLIVIKDTSINNLVIDDVISYYSEEEDKKDLIITHKIRTIDYENKEIITYGTKTNTDDLNPVKFDNVIGLYKFKISKVGIILNFIKSLDKIIIISGLFLLCFGILFIKSTLKYLNIKKRIINRIYSENYKKICIGG